MSKELIEQLRSKTIRPFDLDPVADLIEAQQSWIASLEQNARDADRMYKELEGELAASQAQIKVLREALEKIVECDFWEDVREIISEALARPRQPVMRKVKMLCWLDSEGELRWIESDQSPFGSIRIPAQDIEIEIPEGV